MIAKVVLPYPPSINHYWLTGHGGRRYISKEGNTFRQWALVLCRTQQIPSFGDSEIKLDITINPPDRRRRDVDNVLKVLLDALQAAKVYDNDYQVRRLSIERLDPLGEGRCTVTIESTATT